MSNLEPTQSVKQDILVTLTSDDFIEGMCSGSASYHAEYQNKPLTDLDIQAFIAQNINDAEYTASFNIGYCIGWIDTFLKFRKMLD